MNHIHHKEILAHIFFSFYDKEKKIQIMQWQRLPLPNYKLALFLAILLYETTIFIYSLIVPIATLNSAYWCVW